MEAAMTESEEDLVMAEGDDELVKLPESWLGKIGQAEEESMLPDNLYDLSGLQGEGQTDQICGGM
jgi:hypothetical protein